MDTNLKFTVPDLSESELTFLINASFQVQINAADARLVSDLQQRLITILNEGKAPKQSDLVPDAAVKV